MNLTEHEAFVANVLTVALILVFLIMSGPAIINYFKKR